MDGGPARRTRRQRASQLQPEASKHHRPGGEQLRCVCVDNEALPCRTCLIGVRLRVLWEHERRWYTGTVASYQAETGAHKIDYDDGDKRWHPALQAEQWEALHHTHLRGKRSSQQLPPPAQPPAQPPAPQPPPPIFGGFGGGESEAAPRTGAGGTETQAWGTANQDEDSEDEPIAAMGRAGAQTQAWNEDEDSEDEPIAAMGRAGAETQAWAQGEDSEDEP